MAFCSSFVMDAAPLVASDKLRALHINAEQSDTIYAKAQQLHPLVSQRRASEPQASKRMPVRRTAVHHLPNKTPTTP